MTRVGLRGRVRGQSVAGVRSQLSLQAGRQVRDCGEVKLDR